MPDATLIATLERERKGKRNDYPVAAMWNAVIAGIIIGHPSSASLLRELARNGELWEVCGFDPRRRAKGISKFSWSRFLAGLRRHQDLIDAMFEAVLGTLTQLLPDLGKRQSNPILSERRSRGMMLSSGVKSRGSGLTGFFG